MPRAAPAAPTDARYASAVPIFTALADETRLRLVNRLCREGPLSIASLTVGTALTRQAVTKHLQVLSAAGLARSSRRGREQRWSIETAQLAESTRLLAQISSQWDAALRRLERLVENA